MLTPEETEILRRVATSVPQYIKLLEFRLEQELSDLPSVSLDKVQIYQGRARALQGLLADLYVASGNTANRTAKPNFSTP